MDPPMANEYSDGARDQAQQEISAFVEELTREARAISRRKSSDAISTNDVREAAAWLYSKKRGLWIRNVGTIGGILAGAGLGTALSMFLVEQYSTNGVASVLVTTIVGFLMVGVHVARE